MFSQAFTTDSERSSDLRASTQREATSPIENDSEISIIWVNFGERTSLNFQLIPSTNHHWAGRMWVKWDGKQRIITRLQAAVRRVETFKLRHPPRGEHSPLGHGDILAAIQRQREKPLLESQFIHKGRRGDLVVVIIITVKSLSGNIGNLRWFPRVQILPTPLPFPTLALLLSPPLVQNREDVPISRSSQKESQMTRGDILAAIQRQREKSIARAQILPTPPPFPTLALLLSPPLVQNREDIPISRSRQKESQMTRGMAISSDIFFRSNHWQSQMVPQGTNTKQGGYSHQQK